MWIVISVTLNSLLTWLLKMTTFSPNRGEFVYWSKEQFIKYPRSTSSVYNAGIIYKTSNDTPHLCLLEQTLNYYNLYQPNEVWGEDTAVRATARNSMYYCIKTALRLVTADNAHLHSL